MRHYGDPYPLHGMSLYLHRCDYCVSGGSCYWTDGDTTYSLRWWLKVFRFWYRKETP